MVLLDHFNGADKLGHDLVVSSRCKIISKCLLSVRLTSERGSCPAGTPSGGRRRWLTSCDPSGWGSRRPWWLLRTCSRRAGQGLKQTASHCNVAFQGEFRKKRCYDSESTWVYHFSSSQNKEIVVEGEKLWIIEVKPREKHEPPTETLQDYWDILRLKPLSHMYSWQYQESHFRVLFNVARFGRLDKCWMTKTG